MVWMAKVAAAGAVVWHMVGDGTLIGTREDVVQPPDKFFEGFKLAEEFLNSGDRPANRKLAIDAIRSGAWSTYRDHGRNASEDRCFKGPNWASDRKLILAAIADTLDTFPTEDIHFIAEEGEQTVVKINIEGSQVNITIVSPIKSS